MGLLSILNGGKQLRNRGSRNGLPPGSRGGMDCIVGGGNNTRRSRTQGRTSTGRGLAGSKPGLPGHGSPDVMALAEAVSALVTGNTEEEVELVSGEAFTREVGLNLRLEIGWEWTSETVKGARSIQGSVRLADHVQAEAFLEEVCSKDCRDPGDRAHAYRDAQGARGGIPGVAR